MVKFQYTIKDAEGIHARPAGILVKAAAEFPCQVMIEKDGKSVDAKRIFGVMSLGVKCNESVTIICDGEQEEEALEKVSAVLKENL